MPQPKTFERPQATAKNVRSAGATGNAQFEFFKKYNRLPSGAEDLKEFIK